MAKRSANPEPLLTGAPQEQTERPLHILELRAENFKRLSVVQVTPEGSLVQITGKNAQGKSSVLDAIAAALGGAKLVPAEAVRRGHDSGEVELDLGEIKVRRTFTKSGGGNITIVSQDGTKLKTPQAVLEEMIRPLSFDPLAFCAMKPKDQRAAVLEAVGITERVDTIAGNKAKAYADRTVAGREVDRLKAVLSTLASVPDSTPDEELSAADVAAQMQAEGAKVAKAQQWLAAKKADVSRLTAEVGELETRLAQAKAALATASTEMEKFGPDAQKVIDGHNPEALRAKLTHIEATNAMVRSKRERTRTSSELKKAEETYREHNRAVEDADMALNVLLADAKIPVPGMTFDDDGLLLNKVPFAQASTAQKLTAAVRIGLASNPRIRVMLVREGSFLDSDQLGLLAQIAEAHDAQVWVERVTDGQAGVGVVIEDGHVRAEGGEA